jgi:hypothetical protein
MAESAELPDNWRCGCGETNKNANRRQSGQPTPKALIAAASSSLNVCDLFTRNRLKGRGKGGESRLK